MAKRTMTAAQKKAFAERMKKARAAKMKKAKTKPKRARRGTSVKRWLAYAQKKSGTKYYWDGAGFDSDKNKAIPFLTVHTLKASPVMVAAKRLPRGYALLADEVTLKRPKA